MSSIASTLNSLNTSLLSEISAYRATGRTARSATPATSTAVPQDRVEVSKASKVFQQLSALEESDPAKARDLLTEAAAKLAEAADQATDPGQAEKLKQIAEKFQKAAETGDLSELRPPGRQDAGPAGAAYGRNGGPPPPPPPPDDHGGNDPLTATLQELLASVSKAET